MRREKPKQAVYLLIGELLRSDRLPPVTLAVIALNVIVYLELFELDFPSLGNVCLSANQILEYKDWKRLILSPFFHGDDWHLYYNMISFSIKGRSLERRYGSFYFFVLLAIFTVSCSLTYVGLEFLGFKLFDKYAHLDSCAVGFSGVIFALKVLTTHHLPSGTVYLGETIPIPSKYAYWGELVLISMLTPNASFAGILKILNFNPRFQKCKTNKFYKFIRIKLNILNLFLIFNDFYFVKYSSLSPFLFNLT